jgi:hypothetical protein
LYKLTVEWVLYKFDFIGFKIYSFVFSFLEFGTPAVISFFMLEKKEYQEKPAGAVSVALPDIFSIIAGLRFFW